MMEAAMLPPERQEPQPANGGRGPSDYRIVQAVIWLQVAALAMNACLMLSIRARAAGSLR